MNEYVKIEIRNGVGKTLKHHYLRVDKWDLPAGKIEYGETPLKAAVRELIERTGYRISEIDLQEMQKDGQYFVFLGQKKNLIRVAKPGEKGGYTTEIRWD